MLDLWVHLAVSSRPSVQQLEKPDGRTCWVDSGVQLAGVGWQNVVDVAMQLRWLAWYDRRGTEVLVRANNGTSWGRAWRWLSQAHPASAVCHEGVSTDHDQISSCRWLLERRRWICYEPGPSCAYSSRTRAASCTTYLRVVDLLYIRSIYTVSKKRPTLWLSISSPNTNRFSEFFYQCILWTISNKVIIEYPVKR